MVIFRPVLTEVRGVLLTTHYSCKDVHGNVAALALNRKWGRSRIPDTWITHGGTGCPDLDSHRHRGSPVLGLSSLSTHRD